MEFHSSKQSEGCCSCRVAATNAEEIIVVLSGDCMEGKKKKTEESNCCIFE